MEELAKIIHELFNDLREENKSLKNQVKWLETHCRIVEETKREIRGLVMNYLSSSDEEDHISSIWGKDADRIFDVLFIEASSAERRNRRKGEENDDNL